MEEFTDKSGKKRKAIVVNCNQCGLEFATREDQPGKYCSTICSGLGRRKRVRVNCASCGNVIQKIKSKLVCSKSGLYFCNRKCKEEAQKLGGIQSIMPSHYGTTNHHREIYKRENHSNELKCERCGYDEFECGIDIHHLDGNHANNTLSNLMPLCSPCHRALHAKLWKLKGD